LAVVKAIGTVVRVNPYISLAITIGSAIAGAVIGEKLAVGAYEHIYDVLIDADDNVVLAPVQSSLPKTVDPIANPWYGRPGSILPEPY
jgi:hypothetical protein